MPCCSASPLRWAGGCLAARTGALGAVLGAEARSPAAIDREAVDAGHLELCWEAVHGVEMLYAAMGSGCASVNRTCTPESDVCVGTWPTSRPIAPRRGTYRDHAEYSGTAETVEGAHPLGEGGLTPEACSGAMLGEVVRWFRGGAEAAPPVTPEETLEVYAFIAAAEESKARGGRVAVTLEEVLAPARRAAQVVIDREWYTPGTARALGHPGGRLGAAPFLALVTDDDARQMVGQAIMGQRALARETTASAIPEEHMWFGKSAEGWGEKKWWEKETATPAEDAMEEEEAVEEEEVDEVGVDDYDS